MKTVKAWAVVHEDNVSGDPSTRKWIFGTRRDALDRHRIVGCNACHVVRVEIRVLTRKRKRPQ